MTHPRHRLDDLIHSPVRLSIMAALGQADAVHFGLLRDTVEVSDSLLSKHLASLEGAGYIAVTKGYVGRRPRTWYSLTAEGRAAFDAYIAALREIVDAPEPPAASDI
ncbi:transcriptional regulator [Microbacterium sp. p3-SID336]|uniref:winged helix-turn-helix domain-containing protein n=1 Tax=Microbacterium sp. p3-SID336 TaxID=2916212 RepID=UPI0021A37E4C|nr:transcriptional regulator [Microbacterium sp. p3-SID336]MCT1479106.1 transcriptional regulator [Microbacterium sp. p3-SID336]